jgi:AbrB family looped-hinge helix DNA binding protein
VQTRISSEGRVVLPGPIRRKLGLNPGDALDASVKSGQIVLNPRHSRPGKVIVGGLDAVTGLPVLSAGSRAPQLTSEQVQEILSSLP